MGQKELAAWQSRFSAAVDSAHEVVHARGELTLFTWELLRGAVDNLLVTGHRRVTVDLAGVGPVDRSAARALLVLREQMRVQHRPLLLRNLPPTLRDRLPALHRSLHSGTANASAGPSASGVSGVLRIEQRAEATVVQLRGEIDIAVVETICRPALERLPDRDVPMLVDLAGVSFLDVTGLNLLIELRNRSGGRDVEWRLLHVPRQARRLITAAGLSTVLLQPDARAAAWYATGPAARLNSAALATEPRRYPGQG